MGRSSSNVKQRAGPVEGLAAPENADSSTKATGPRAECAGRLEARRQLGRDLDRREQVVGNARVGVFLIGAVLAWLAFGALFLSPWWLMVPLAAFIVLLFVHGHVLRSLYLAGRAASFYERALARLEDRWQGTGQPGDRFRDENHLYAADLDLFGKGSLFELLCTAKTRTGEDTLAAWLRAPAGPEEVRARQAAVAELRPRLDLREDLALLGADVPVGVDFGAVAAWGAMPPVLLSRWPRLVALVLGVLSVTALAGWLAEGWPVSLFLLLVLLELAFFSRMRARVQPVLRAVEDRARDLALLANVLARLERESFASPRLRELGAALDAGHGLPPSRAIARLSNLVDVLNWRRNQLFAPLAYLLLWGTHLAYAFESWRARSGPAIARWLEVVGQFEALCALAGYAYENPNDPFPEVLDGRACYDGEGLGHPLIPRGKCVRNDLHLTGDLRVLVVSGSNMSGKSTFLRTVGVNAVLALAGAPVRAVRLRLTRLAVGATLRIEDSLQAGRSRFQTEILRVRQVVELTRGPLPLLFLFDEIFHGTNSHDRRLGAESVVRGLVEAGALGLVTTHDLSLTHIVDHLDPRAANVHFEDRLDNGVMTFDYRMRPGVVQHSNALALMRAVGLDV
jgi:hypothetical protein